MGRPTLGSQRFVRTGEKLKFFSNLPSTQHFAPEGLDLATVVGPNLGHRGRQNLVGFSMGADVGRTWGDLDLKKIKIMIRKPQFNLLNAGPILTWRLSTDLDSHSSKLFNRGRNSGAAELR